MHGHQGFLIPVILAATAALTPARTQTLAPSAEPPNSATKSVVSIPDLSGYGDAGSILNPRYQDRVRLSASFGGRMGPSSRVWSAILPIRS
jgi:hypothetical protein